MYKNYFNLGNIKSREEILKKIEDFFSQEVEGCLIYFSGMAQNNGDWLLDDEDRTSIISFGDIVQRWRKKKKCQKHLLIIVDSDFSGHWCRKLMLRPTNSISIQSSSSYW